MTGAEATIISSGIAAATGLTTALGVLALAQHGERERAKATADDRKADRVEAVRARLHSDRLDAYREFTVAYSVWDAANEQARIGWAQRQLRADHIKAVRTEPQSARDEAYKAFDAAQAWWSARALEAHEANGRLIDSLSLLELVASEPVAAAARTVIEVARKASTAQMQLSTSPSQVTPDMWDRVQKADEEVSVARHVLRNAIRTELHLDA